MIVKLAGGVAETGRSCFFVRGERTAFLVDCGLQEDDDAPYPRLSPQEIAGARYVFLTHSHPAHTGAFTWLRYNGSTGTVVASRPTLRQLPFAPVKAVPLERFHPPAGLSVRWGKSGHCVGSVWYAIEAEGVPLLFCGAYIENAAVCRTDPIRGERAQLAVLDGSFGPAVGEAAALRADFLRAAQQALQAGGPLLLPVPKYGCGLELALALAHAQPQLPLCGDAHFARQLRQALQEPGWLRPAAAEVLQAIDLAPAAPAEGGCAVFVSDPQLSSPASQRCARGVLRAGGRILLTSHSALGGYAARLLEAGRAGLCVAPVHGSARARRRLTRQNHFERVIEACAPGPAPAARMLELAAGAAQAVEK